jgi:parallel beta-helix repeat protein
MFQDWVIENNVIMTDHWHGISLYGAINCRIVNNTVCDLNTVDPGPPWIMITSHKDGTKSTGCVIRNNLSTAVTNDGDATCVADHNIIIKNPDDFFVGYQTFDLHLKAGCIAIDSGSSALAPAIDITGAPRPFGKAVDVGAYEFDAAGSVQQHAGATDKNRGDLCGNVICNLRSGRQMLELPAKASSLSVYDVNGRCLFVYKRKYGVAGRVSFKIPSHLPMGMLYVKPFIQ